VAGAVILTNAGLIGLALLAPALGWPVLAAGAALVLVLLWRLHSAVAVPPS
jgi:hypothetical protein